MPLPERRKELRHERRAGFDRFRLAASFALRNADADAHRRRENFPMAEEIQACQVDRDASTLRCSESIEARLGLFERSLEHQIRRCWCCRRLVW